jgi:hypothetical protein
MCLRAGAWQRATSVLARQEGVAKEDAHFGHRSGDEREEKKDGELHHLLRVSLMFSASAPRLLYLEAEPTTG